MEKISIFWMRRDLRLDDNTALSVALKAPYPVLPLFIFDSNILEELPQTDARVTFIHQQIMALDARLQMEHQSQLLVKFGTPEAVFKELLENYELQAVYANRDYEPYAKARDASIEKMLREKAIPFHLYKDQVIFEKEETLNGSNEVYKVFTPFSKRWLAQLHKAPDSLNFSSLSSHFHNLPLSHPPQLEEMGFSPSSQNFPSKEVDEDLIAEYGKKRDFPALEGTTRLGLHLRFGTISIRKRGKKAQEVDKTFLNELIWREFYMMILDAYPEVVDHAFKSKYDNIQWRNNPKEFELWCEGKTGYPLVDAGMRQMNQSGYMHNRVRMVTASFLTKHLLIDWRWGEAYFAEKLLDYELASNNGGWQWAAGSGTDAQPYFRIFNPASQLKKFDKDLEYVKKWVPEFGTEDYPQPMVEHTFARERALEEFKKAVKK